MMIRLLTWCPMLAAVTTRDEEEFVTELHHLPQGWLGVLGLAVVGAAVWAVFWMYRREGRIGASFRLRMALAVLRGAVFVTLAVIFLEPVRVRILRRWIDSYVIVLVDDSSSMDLADTYRRPEDADRVKAALGIDSLEPIRRSEIVHRLLRRGDRKFLRDLALNNRVKFSSFSGGPTLRGTIRALREKRDQAAAGSSPTRDLLSVRDLPIDLSATGAATNIERAVRRSVEGLGGAPVAAVIVISDGGFNDGAGPEDTARYARERSVPIHVVGIGDPAPPSNVRVTEILAPENAFKQDPFAISAHLTAEGLDGQTIRVELRERDATAGGPGRVVDTRTRVVQEGGTIEPVTFQRRQRGVGRFVYTAQIPVLESESVADDNSKQTTVNVIDTRTRVLLIAGGPSWDYRFLSRLLERDESVDVSCWLQSADLSAVRDGNTVIDHLPRLPEELFDYDLIILMDPAQGEFDEPWCRLIDQLVTEHGGGVLLTAARAHTPAFMREPGLEPLSELLPVVLDPEADLILNQIGHYQRSPSPLRIPDAVYGHPIMKLADDLRSTKLAWQGIGDVYWHYPVHREKPAATVLMRHDDPRMRNSFGGHVLAAVQYVGAGRSGFIAFDGIWRWRRHRAEIPDRFWVQFVRYLAEGKLLGGTSRGILLTERDQYSLGEAVTVSARLFDARYEPLERDQVPASYADQTQTREFALTAQRDRPGWFEGRFVPGRTGTHRIIVQVAAEAAGESLEVAKEILVSRPNIEVLKPQMNRSALAALANQSAGGRYFDVSEMSELPPLVEDLHEEIAIRSRPTSLWDNGWVLTLLITLLVAEWALRKWHSLL